MVVACPVALACVAIIGAAIATTWALAVELAAWADEAPDPW